MRSRLALAACLCLGACGAVQAQTLEIIPTRVMPDEPAVIRVNGLEPNERVTIQADLVDGADEPWASSADFVADATGAIDVSKQAPVSGSYKIVSSMGLLWSMMPKEKEVKAYRLQKELGAQTIQFRLLRKGQPAGTAQLEQRSIAPDVKRFNIEGTLHGVLYEPTGEGPHPGVLVLGGSNGGYPGHQAAWLASRGFAALALAYFHYENLPQKLEAIPLEYFGSALAWMAKRPEISADHIAVLGTSRGAELALQLGSMYPQIKAVVAYVPSNTLNGACCGDTRVPFAWTWNGSPLAFLAFRNRSNQDAVRNATIRVENTHGPILLISGQDDGVWESSRMADEIVARLKNAHFQFKVEHLNYHHAGHLAGQPEIAPAWRGHFEHPISGREVNLGGSVEGNAESSLDAIPKVLEFLRESLNLIAAEQPAANPSQNNK